MSRTATVVVLGIGQTLGWGSTYYLPAVLAAPMASELGVLALFWGGLLVIAVALLRKQER